MAHGQRLQGVHIQFFIDNGYLIILRLVEPERVSEWRRQFWSYLDASPDDRRPGQTKRR